MDDVSRSPVRSDSPLRLLFLERFHGDGVMASFSFNCDERAARRLRPHSTLLIFRIPACFRIKVPSDQNLPNPKFIGTFSSALRHSPLGCLIVCAPPTEEASRVHSLAPPILRASGGDGGRLRNCDSSRLVSERTESEVLALEASAGWQQMGFSAWEHG